MLSIKRGTPRYFACRIVDILNKYYVEWLLAEDLRFVPKLSAVSLGGLLNSFGE